jgi:hypothetical protein
VKEARIRTNIICLSVHTETRIKEKDMKLETLFGERKGDKQI